MKQTYYLLIDIYQDLIGRLVAFQNQRADRYAFQGMILQYVLKLLDQVYSQVFNFCGVILKAISNRQFNHHLNELEKRTTTTKS